VSGQRWFKVHASEVLLSDDLEDLKPGEECAWWRLLCVVSLEEERGTTRVTKGLARKLRLPARPQALTAYLRRLEALGMVRLGDDETVSVTNWVRYQERERPPSWSPDASRERQQRSRARRRDVSQPLSQGEVVTVTTDVTKNVTTEKKREEERREEKTREDEDRAASASSAHETYDPKEQRLKERVSELCIAVGYHKLNPDDLEWYGNIVRSYSEEQIREAKRLARKDNGMWRPYPGALHAQLKTLYPDVEGASDDGRRAAPTGKRAAAADPYSLARVETDLKALLGRG